ncbi:MAG: hypothetical protein ACLQGP_22750 [Isosphaeraceae bacterium]
MSKQFLAVGDYLINPELLTYAISEGRQLRLGFAHPAPDAHGELRLDGEEAREVLRWLRLNAIFLTKAGRFGSVGVPVEDPIEDEPRGFARRAHAAIHDRGWGPVVASEPEGAGRPYRRPFEVL